MAERISSLLKEYGGGILPAEAEQFIAEYFENDYEEDEHDDDNSDDEIDIEKVGSGSGGNNKDETEDIVSEDVLEREFMRDPELKTPTATTSTTSKIASTITTATTSTANSTATTSAANSPTASTSATSNTETTFSHQISDSGVDKFYEIGCGCSKKCTETIPKKVAAESRIDCLDLNENCNFYYNHLHLVLLGALNAITAASDTARQLDGSMENRQRQSTDYRVRGVSVCINFFRFCFGTGKDRLRRIQAQFKESGVMPKTHGGANHSRPESYEARVRIFKFINNFADQNALVLPGRIPSVRNADLKVLPCSMTKKHVFELYVAACEACEEINVKSVKINAWYKIWNEVCSNIVIQTPRTDLCAECQGNVISMNHMASLNEDEKLERLQKSSDHLVRVKSERGFYKKISADIVLELETSGLDLILEPHKPCSYTGSMHYSFDYAQQVHLPHSSQQIGPLFFLTGYKIALFGVAVEPLGKFVLYIIPESCVIGKGSNVVISLVHHFFENFGLGETDVHLHADNCSGQNKNNYLMQYGSWRVATGRHESFKISFLPVGHTKFSPDLYFGLFKKCFRRSEINNLEELMKCISSSCEKSKSIIPCLVGSEKGDLYVKTYDWQGLFATLRAKKISGLLKYYHFEIQKSAPKNIQYKYFFDDVNITTTSLFSPEVEIEPDILPIEMNPDGLSFERQKYLFERIRAFVSITAKDVLCPEPQVPKTLDFEENVQDVPGPSVLVDEVQEEENPACSSTIAKAKGIRKCSRCHKTGHNIRKCPQK